MPVSLEKELHTILDFEEIKSVETIQSLWSGYGSLDRVWLSGFEQESIIVKNIRAPKAGKHPRGWNTDVGHQRKLKSYEVEANWYRHHNQHCDNTCRTPQFLGYQQFESHTMLVLEDLNHAGFYLRKQVLHETELHACLEWLAAFHAKFMRTNVNDLWPIGTYWHWATRQAEWQTMKASPLKEKASAIDDKLNAAEYKTLVHGDAKYANFCFSETGAVAAVDFQYVGGGCGIKDVAYLLSCIDGGIQDQKQERELLDHYFQSLKTRLSAESPEIDFTHLENEWRALYPLAWADFERFLQGWAPGHWKSTAYAQRQVELALKMM